MNFLTELFLIESLEFLRLIMFHFQLFLIIFNILDWRSILRYTVQDIIYKGYVGVFLRTLGVNPYSFDSKIEGVPNLVSLTSRGTGKALQCDRQFEEMTTTTETKDIVNRDYWRERNFLLTRFKGLVQYERSETG